MELSEIKEEYEWTSLPNTFDSRQPVGTDKIYLEGRNEYQRLDGSRYIIDDDGVAQTIALNSNGDSWAEISDRIIIDLFSV